MDTVREKMHICVHKTRSDICFYCSVYASALKDHLITNVAGGKTVCLKKTNFPDTGQEDMWDC